MMRQYQIICAGKREKETMSEQRLQQASSWTKRREEKERRMQAVTRCMSGPVLATDKIVEAPEALVVAGDRIVLEGDNQKQADFLSRSLVKVDAKKIHDLHLIISSISRPSTSRCSNSELQRGWTSHLQDLRAFVLHSYSRAGSSKSARFTLTSSCTLACWSISSQTSSLCVQSKRTARAISLQGPNTEDTPVIVEAAAFHDAIVIVQVNEIVEKLPRVDISGSWIDIVVQADKPFALEPLFMRDPLHINDLQILTAMMVI
jgi:malonate decarboxylase alpha subunit